MLQWQCSSTCSSSSSGCTSSSSGRTNNTNSTKSRVTVTNLILWVELAHVSPSEVLDSSKPSQSEITFGVSAMVSTRNGSKFVIIKCCTCTNMMLNYLKYKSTENETNTIA